MNRLRAGFEFGRAVFTNFGDDQGATYAASIAYYALLSIFPLLLGLVALLGFFLEEASVRTQLVDFLAGYLPQARDLISNNANQVRESRGLAGLIAISGFLWSAKAIFGAINDGVNRVWNVKDRRPFWLRTLVQLGLVLGTGVVFLISLAATTVLRLLADLEWSFFSIERGAPLLWGAVSFVLPIFFNVLMFALLYRYVPQTRVRWGDVWGGALFAAIGYEIAKNLFLWYTTHFGNYNAVYGSLGAAVALLAWAYLAATILLLGAEVCAVKAGLRTRSTTGKGVTLIRPAA